MKTIKQTFEEKLPHYLAQLACHYTSTRVLNLPSCEDEDLCGAFIWAKTPQGNQFWFYIHKTYFWRNKL